MKNFEYNPLRETVLDIMDFGGFVNAHAHLDRAYTVTRKSLAHANDHLFKKWTFVDEIKSKSNVEDYKTRISTALANQTFLRTQAVCSFVDIDPICGQNALVAARLSAHEYEEQIRLIIACQTLKGVLDKTARRTLEASLEDVDIIGSLPGADPGKEDKHLDVVMMWAKSLGKRLHVHVDQLNSPLERETELLARKTMQHGLEGHVTAIHSISLAAHKKAYRREVYKMASDAGLSFITCPSAWIDHKRSDELMPSHNSITPVDEMLEQGLTVAIGSDNICDVYKPFCDGDMINELRLLIDACRIYNPVDIINIAVHNGKKVLGIENE
tara:strand:+ start:2758 stop:3738 length:981 start_codon:yes stop_codon:yes gene_type:complete